MTFKPPSAAALPTFQAKRREKAVGRPRAAAARAPVTPLDWLARLGMAFVAMIGLAVAVGWILDIAILRSVLPGLASMKMNTACGLGCASLALWLLHTSAVGARPSQAGRMLAALVGLLGGVTLAQYLFSVDLGIDQLLLRDVQGAGQPGYPGRMSPITAVSFIAVGGALLTLNARRQHLADAAQGLACVAIAISLLAILGYAYGVRTLYEVRPYASMAIHTATAFLVLGLSILAADPIHGITNLATSDTAGGIVCRRLLPTVPIMLFAIGWGCLAGQRAGLYGSAFSFALMTLLSIGVSILAVISTAITLRRVDMTRLRAQAEISALHADLEAKVLARTQLLDQLTDELTAANAALEQLSLHDGLTKVANRRFFDTYLASQVAVANRHRRTLALIMFDVDAFKEFNDRYGHQAGDDCLTRIAAALGSCCRRPADMVARYGGEEFAMILPDTQMPGADQVAQAARHAVRQLNIPHEGSTAAPRVSISGGLALLDLDTHMTPAELIAAADEALFRAKHEGRNRIVHSWTRPPE